VKASKPAIPKRLAARLRASYLKAGQARDQLAYIEAKTLDNIIYLKEFEDAPDRFAELRYPSAGGPQSYPVQTNIGRIREWLERKTRRMAVYLKELADAEGHLAETEREVLAEVSSMRKETPGRIPWPSAPSSLDSRRKEYLRKYEKERELIQKRLLKSDQQRTEEVARSKRESEEMQRETDRLMAAKLAQMPPNKAAVYGSFYEVMRSAIDSGTFSLDDILRLSDGDRAVLVPILEEAKRRLIDGMESED
jgi:hypothetical protein